MTTLQLKRPFAKYTYRGKELILWQKDCGKKSGWVEDKKRIESCCEKHFEELRG